MLSLRRATRPGQRLQSVTGFLSTLSLRRATSKSSTSHRATQISIHALLAESDSDRPPAACLGSHFYPRSPCGERHAQLAPVVAGVDISIHALLAESDMIVYSFMFVCIYFYPRSPCGERPAQRKIHRPVYLISIHALLAESD